MSRVARLDDSGATGPVPDPVARLDGSDPAGPVPDPVARLDGSGSSGTTPDQVLRSDGPASARATSDPLGRPDDDGSAGAAPVARFGGPTDLVVGDGGSVPVALTGSTGPAADGRPAAADQLGGIGTVARPVAELGGARPERAVRPIERVRTPAQLIVQQESGPEPARFVPDDQQRPPARARRPPGPKQIDPDADPVAAAREICLRLLTERARTRTELAQALARRGVPDEAAHTVLERFDEVGLIDDAAFAGQWVQSRQRRGLARRAIAHELRRKGVDEEVAGEALAVVDGDAEARRARELVDRRLRTLPAGTPEQRVVAARKLVGMLARKGYGGGTAYGVVKEALAAHGADHDELDADQPFAD